MNLSRVPPHSKEAEQSILGCILIESALIDDISTELQASDFYYTDNAEIYEAMLRLQGKGQAIDIVTLENELGNECEKVGGYVYIVGLTNSVATSAGWKHYLKIILDNSILRQLIKTSTATINDCYDRIEASEALSKAEVEILKINSVKSSQNIVTLKDTVLESVDNLKKRANNKTRISGLSTGFRDLDYKLAGLQKSDLVVIAARPAMGKTSLAVNIAEHVGIELNEPVLVFSLEMSKEQLTDRIICSQKTIDSHNYKTGNITDDELNRLIEPMDKLINSNLNIDDTANIKVSQIASKCRKMKKSKGLSLVVIDYIQLLTGDKSKDKNQEVSEMSRQLKILAKDLNCPVIILSQLNRGVEQRAEKIPTLADLRDSGAIEQDADIVMFLYRDEYYNPDSNKKGIAECIIAKHRTGSTGTVELTWEGKYTKFGNIPFEYRKVGKY